LLPLAIRLDTLEVVQEIDGRPILLDRTEEDDDFSVREFTSVADLVAVEELALGRQGLALLGVPLLERALGEPDSYRKGLYFEQVLCLLFSQASYFRVLDHRYINETEEIDVVLANRATDELADILGGPLVLVSAKNVAKPAGAPEVRALRGNMGNRRGRCKLGILCSAREVASTAKTEQIRSTTDPTLAVALIDGTVLRGLLESPRLDEDLAAELRKAVLD
jgi:hypothetical protein